MSLFKVTRRFGLAQVNIDGRTFEGNSVTIETNGKVIVDGVEQSGSLVGPVNVVIQGDVDQVETGSGDVTVKGSAGMIRTGSGDVQVGHDVLDGIRTGSGDVTVADSVSGNVTTGSGDIVHRRS